MIEAEITSVASFLEQARKLLNKFSESPYWFRGHAHANWNLVPSVHRPGNALDEQNLALRFRLSALSRYPKCPARDDIANWLTLMRHYGLPTRLLDWTESPLVAMYFAVEHEQHEQKEKISGPAAIWCLWPFALNALTPPNGPQVGVLSSLSWPEHESSRLLRDAFARQGQPIDQALAVVGDDFDLRMAVQQVGYTIHGNNKPLEQTTGLDNWLAKFTIPQSAREALRCELWSLGVHRSTLFPDLDNLAIDLRNDHRRIPPREHTMK